MRAVLALFCLWLCGSARAVIVYGGDGSQNATGDGAGAGWNYVGQVNGGAGGVYLGNYGGQDWVLTAGHVGAGSFSLNGVTYASVLDSAVSLTNPDGTAVDLTLFRIAGGDPALANLELASATPASNASLTMIGYGIGREASETRWDASWNETTGPAALYRGYKWSGTAVKRWGRNTVAGTTTVTYANGVTTTTFDTQFKSSTGSAQATSGDSGGGVFASTGALAGIMIAVSTSSGQPGNVSIFGTLTHSETYLADVSAYRSEILGIISPMPVPEPGVLALLGLAGLAIGGCGRFRKAPADLR